MPGQCSADDGPSIDGEMATVPEEPPRKRKPRNTGFRTVYFGLTSEITWRTRSGFRSRRRVSRMSTNAQTAQVVGHCHLVKTAILPARRPGSMGPASAAVVPRPMPGAAVFHTLPSLT